MWAASVLLTMWALAPQTRDARGAPQQRTAPPTYPFTIEPRDALWGHLDEGRFREPMGVYFEPIARELYVADSKNGRIGIFDHEGTPLFTFGGSALLIEPKAVLASRDGTIFVLDSARADVREFSYRGELKHVLAFPRPSTPMSSNEPSSSKSVESAGAVVVGSFTRDSAGRWYVIDRELLRVFVYTPERVFLREIPPPAGRTEFVAPSDVAVSPKGLVAVSDQRGAPALHVYDAENRLVGAFGGRDIGLSDFTSAVGVAFDEHEYLFAVDMLRHDVKVFTADGRFMAHFGGWFAPETRGRAPGELLYPVDIEVAAEGPIFIAERFGQRVQIFDRKPTTPPTGVK